MAVLSTSVFQQIDRPVLQNVECNIELIIKNTSENLERFVVVGFKVALINVWYLPRQLNYVMYEQC